MTPTNLMTFASSATSTLLAPTGFPLGSVLALPSVDGGNIAARITNNGLVDIWLNFGTGNYLPAGPATKGSFIVPPGAAVLLPSAAGAATNVGVTVGNAGGASFTFERGTITTATFYDNTAMAAQV